MKIKGPLIPATFVERPNRFITIIKIKNKLFKSHLPDPGRLKELLYPGVRLLVRPVPFGSKRKTQYSTVMVKHNNQLISLVSTFPNQFVKRALEKKELPMLECLPLVRPEIKIRNHRIDFLLKNKKGENFYLEVKSVTFVENGIAQFPDAITKRGMKHALLLKQLAVAGYGAGILFVCQRPDAHMFQPMIDRDPVFAKALFDAYNQGVKIWCITLNVKKTEITFKKEIPVNFGNILENN